MEAEQTPTPTDDELDGMTTFEVNGVEVRDGGRVRVPHRFRDRHEIGEEDIIHLHVSGPQAAFWTLHMRHDGRGSYTIPARKRDLFGIEDGDYVDLRVSVTGDSERDL